MQIQQGQTVETNCEPRNTAICFRGAWNEQQALIAEANENAAKGQPGQTVSGLIYALLREEYPLTFKQIVGKWRAKRNAG